MWKTRKTNALLEPLIPVVGGEVAEGSLKGSCEGYGVQARPRKGYPIDYSSSALYGDTGPAEVDMLQLTLAGVKGSVFWRCQSSASSQLQDLASRFTAGGLLRRFQPGQFKFEGVDTLHEATEKLFARIPKALGMPIPATADRELQERLIAAGLFEELDALRWGAHPYLPKAEFTPSGSELAEVYKQSQAFARTQPAIDERLRAAGLPDYAALLDRQKEELAAETPGRLVLDVEVGKERVPTPERFRELLDRAVRIARINEQVNQSTEAGERA